MKTIEVRSQAEFDLAVKESPDEIHVLEGTIMVLAVGTIRVRSFNSSSVFAHDSSRVFAYDSSRVFAYDSSRVSAYDSSRVSAHDSSEVSTYGSSEVTAYGSSMVFAYDSSMVFAYDSSEVAAYDSSEVSGFDLSFVMDFRFRRLAPRRGDIGDVTNSMKFLPGDVVKFIGSRDSLICDLNLSPGVANVIENDKGIFRNMENNGTHVRLYYPELHKHYRHYQVYPFILLPVSCVEKLGEHI